MAQTLAHLAVQIRDALERTNHIRSSHPSDNRTLQPDSASPHSREGYWLGSLKPPSDSQGQEPPWWEQPLINRSSVENSTQPIHLALRGRKIGQSEKQAFEMPSDFSQRCNHLASLLGAEKWKEADQETAGIFRGIAQQQNPVWLRTIDIKKLPCQAFRVLDDIWTTYSHAKFGFSVQGQIWCTVSGRSPEFNVTNFRKFGEGVGWHVRGQWLGVYDELIFASHAPQGHLPSLVFFRK